MEHCQYCEASFDDEEAYLEHLHAAHDTEELGRIDRRRVEEFASEGWDLPVGPLIIGGLVVLTALVIAYVSFGVNAGGSTVAAGDVARTPTDVGSADAEYGTINLSIDGEAIDFSKDRYRTGDQAFAFAADDGDVWWTEAENVTLEYALATVSIEVTETSVRSPNRRFQDTDPGTEVRVRVDGEPVDPSTYVLAGAPSRDRADEGDHVNISVRTR